ncbi:MAG TPA: aminoacyl-tRNA hydrolase [Candidatus Binataceae bacterium]|jgi:PTH1 family peptidyl-tRNA hydrolase|nr:aminoacyl-tRNA hydrolase [Candidatus Binataceae bacterium]
MSHFSRLFDRFRQPSSPPRETAAVEGRWLVAGLGNPGGRYKDSRHNTGFMAATYLASRYGIELTRNKFSGLFGDARIADAPAIIVMPQTFYNRSGDCLASLTGYFRIPVERVIVIHDELDLPLGRLQLKRGGSDAGNRGVRSVAAALGPDFIRIRVGVGRPSQTGGAIDHVLDAFDREERRVVEGLLERIADAVEAIIRDGLERAMSIYNQRSDPRA